MAYMNQERKAKLLPGIKAVLNKYGMKGTVAVRNHMTLVVNITSGKLDVCNNSFAVAKSLPALRIPADAKAPTSVDVNVYHIKNHFTGEVREFLLELHDAMMVGNHNNSDLQSDYFDVGWYTDINVGNWNKPYKVVC